MTIVYPPMVQPGTLPAEPANEKINGRAEITLLPKEDFTHKTTPNVIRYNEMRSRVCCQRNDRILSFLLVVGFMFMCISN